MGCANSRPFQRSSPVHRQSIHAFPSVRIYRGSVRAFEPYEYGRESNVIWLHMVKLTAEIVVTKLQQTPSEKKRIILSLAAY